jgi:hypothetical protein
MLRLIQRFSGFGNELPQTGHTFSSGLTITVSLHLEHLTAWSWTRLISMFFETINRLQWANSDVFAKLTYA